MWQHTAFCCWCCKKINVCLTMQKKMIVTQLLKPPIKLKRQRLTNHTGNKLLWKESSYTLHTVALSGCYKPESCSTFDRRGQSRQSESEILFDSSRCIQPSLDESAWGAFLGGPMNRFNPLWSKEKQFFSFPLHLCAVWKEDNIPEYNIHSHLP